MEADVADKQQVLAWESVWGKRAAFAAIAVAILDLAGFIIAQTLPAADDDKAVAFRNFYEHKSMLGVQTGIAVAAFILTIPVFYFLFRALRNRDSARREYFAFVFIGPVLLSIQSVVSWFATSDVATDFHDQVGSRTGDAASDFAQSLVDDSTLIKVAAGLAIPGLLGLIFFMFYLSLSGMRSGLLSRFWGTFGMAFAIGFLFLGPISALGPAVWAIVIGALGAGWIKRPPAWDAVTAMPWPSAGMRPDAADDNDGNAIDVGGREGEPQDGDPHNPPLPESGGSPATPPRKRKRRD